MNEPEWELALSFPDQTPNFAHGFVCGRIWEKMTDGKDVIEGIAPVETRQTIEAMAMALGWVEEITDIDDGWITVKLTNPAP